MESRRVFLVAHFILETVSGSMFFFINMPWVKHEKLRGQILMPFIFPSGYVVFCCDSCWNYWMSCFFVFRVDCVIVHH